MTDKTIKITHNSLVSEMANYYDKFASIYKTQKSRLKAQNMKIIHKMC